MYFNQEKYRPFVGGDLLPRCINSHFINKGITDFYKMKKNK